MLNLNKEEKKILLSIKKGEFRSVPNVKTAIKRYQNIAKTSLKKDMRINIRISATDLDGMRRRAFEDGMPYQTLISSIIHKYVTGKLADKVTSSVG